MSDLIARVKRNDLQKLKGFIAEGADVNVVPDGGRSALWWAVRTDHLECATALIDAKADVDKTTGSGDTPLHRASSNGQVECVRVTSFVWFFFGG
jgi:ankyrin repeat protein